MLYKLAISMALLLTTLVAQANVDNCDKVADKDARAVCIAVGMKNPVLCNDVSNKDGQFHCKAHITVNSYMCEKINSTGIRFDCLARVKAIQQSAIWSFKPI